MQTFGSDCVLEGIAEGGLVKSSFDDDNDGLADKKNDGLKDGDNDREVDSSNDGPTDGVSEGFKDSD